MVLFYSVRLVYTEIVAKQKKMGFTVNFIKKEDLARWTDPALVKKIQNDWIKDYKAYLKNPAGITDKMGQLVQKAIAREK